MIIHQYDENSNGRLSYGEFCQLILPSTNDHLREVAKSREAEYRYIKSAFLPRPVENALANLFTKELEYQRTIDEIKRELNRRFDFSVRRCFADIDKAEPFNTIDRHEIKNFVQEYFTTLNDDELDAIIRRCDTDEDEQISEQEFTDVVKHRLIKADASKFWGRLSTKKVERRTRSPGRSTKLSNTVLKASDLYDRYYRSKYYDVEQRDTDYYRRFSPVRSRYRYWSPTHRRADWLSSPYSRLYGERSWVGWRDWRNWRDLGYSRDLDRTTFWNDAYRRSLVRGARSTKRMRSSSPKNESDSFARETITSSAKKVSRSPTTQVRSTRLSQTKGNNYNYRYTIDSKSANRLSSPIQQQKTRGTRVFSPAKESLQTKFDIAEELVEENKTVTPIKKEALSSTKKSIRTAHTLTLNEEDELVESLKDIVDLDRELESALKSLSMRPDFTLYDGFRVFDYENLGYAELDDIIEAFHVFGIFPTEEEARLFLVRYDINKNDKLNYSEYCDAFVPKDPKCAEILKKRSMKYPEGYYMRRDEFNILTHNAFANVMRLHLEVEINIEAVRQRHGARPMFDYANAFTTLNQWGDDYLTKEDFDNIFKKYNYYPTENELNALVDRFDKNKDGRVSYEEFVEEFSPHSPVKFAA